MRNRKEISMLFPPEKDAIDQFERYRPLMFSIAYRMVGSVTDAEDLLQETFIRWQQAVDTDITSSKVRLPPSSRVPKSPDHFVNTLRSSGGTPSSSAITMAGSG